jgi:predicted ATPase/DNA-binding winged helix-turn-helix (wHTH) protein
LEAKKMADGGPAYQLDRFVVDPNQRQLLIDGRPVRIGARAFDILLALLERRPAVVGKRELLDRVWPGVAVEEGNLHVQIFALRKLLGAGAIVTIPGRGFQLVVEIDGPAPPGSPPAPEPAPARAAHTGPGNLPARLPPLYGRTSDVAALEDLCAAHRLVSVVGPAGIGKTRLAQAVAEARRGIEPEGVWLVELAPLANDELVIPTVARTLGHAAASSKAGLSSLVEAIAGQRLLLVLDNCEHLINAVAELARAIIARAPGVRLLVTSQVPSRLPEEQLYRLGPLAAPVEADVATALDFGAVELFVARVQATDPRFELDGGNVAAIVEICVRLDGVALAIELAAARVLLLGVHGVRQRLNEAPRLLAHGPRGALARHRALSAALEWSYGLLSPEDQQALDRLGVFVGGFSLKAAQHLIADERIDEWTALDHLSTLVENSLVVVDPGEPPRYRLLETTRAFALDRLAATQATETARRAHATALIAALQTDGVNDTPRGRALLVAPEIHNVRAALAWAIGPRGDRALAVELAAAADFIWYVVGQNDEGATLFRALEPWVDASTPPAVAARFWLARIKIYSQATAPAGEAGLKAADIFRSLGDRAALFDALTNTALQFSFAGKVAQAEQALAEAETLLNPTWPLWTRLGFAFFSGSVKYWTGSPLEARQKLSEALRLSHGAGGDVFYAEQTEMMMLACDVALRRGGEAVRTADDLLARIDPPIRGFARGIIESLRIAALTQNSELDEADASLRTALPRIAHAVGTTRTTLAHVSFLLARKGRYEDAARLLGAVGVPGALYLAPPNRASYEDSTAIIVGVLGDDAFERLKTEGRSLSEPEAVALAFPDLESARA